MSILYRMNDNVLFHYIVTDTHFYSNDIQIFLVVFIQHAVPYKPTLDSDVDNGISNSSTAKLILNTLKLFVVGNRIEKLRKYDELANELGLLYKSKTKIVPYVKTWDGIVSKYHSKHRKEF
ncbi:hypothetical protein NAPIS_ORF01577, partial [Vairimorpha apis BRL 01]